MKVAFLKRDDVVVSKSELKQLVESAVSEDLEKINKERDKFHDELKENRDTHERKTANDIITKMLSAYFSARKEGNSLRGLRRLESDFCSHIINHVDITLRGMVNKLTEDITNETHDRVLMASERQAACSVAAILENKISDGEFITKLVSTINNLQVKK